MSISSSSKMVLDMSRRLNPGQSLSEYGLIIWTVGVIGIVALCLLGHSVTSSVTAMVPGSSKSDSHMDTIQADSAIGIPQAPLPPNFQTVYQKFQQSGDISLLVETAGANGTSEILLGMMDTLIAKKLASGQLTEEQANALQQLSNKGHAMAAVEKLAEDKIQAGIAAGQTGKEILGQKVQYNGELITVNDIYYLLGTNSSPAWGDGLSRKELEALDTHQLTYDFYNEFLNIQEKGTIQDPEITQMVSYLSNQIAGLSEGLSENLYRMISTPENKLNPVSLAIKNKSFVEDMTTNELTNLHSASICTIGSGQDTGTYCQ